jgi:hypothetical protein
MENDRRKRLKSKMGLPKKPQTARLCGYISATHPPIHPSPGWFAPHGNSSCGFLQSTHHCKVCLTYLVFQLVQKL